MLGFPRAHPARERGEIRCFARLIGFKRHEQQARRKGNGVAFSGAQVFLGPIGAFGQRFGAGNGGGDFPPRVSTPREISVSFSATRAR